MKTQGNGGCLLTRSTLERGCHARRVARRLREQQHQAPKLSSNLDVLERHTREVLKRLEVGPLEEVRTARHHGVAHSSFQGRVWEV